VVERLTNAYEKWWSELEPLSREPAVIPIGNDRENPVHLTCYNWFGVEGDGGYRLQDDIRKGSRVNGAWRLEVEQAGEYEIVLSRWPRESDMPITSGMPPHQSMDINFAEKNNWLPEGKSLPIARARMKIGSLERSQVVSPSDTSISFTFALDKGLTELQTWFDDRIGKPICGAYYVEVRRKNEMACRDALAERVGSVAALEAESFRPRVAPVHFREDSCAGHSPPGAQWLGKPCVNVVPVAASVKTKPGGEEPVKNLGASPEAFKNMNSESHDTKPKQASGYQTQRE
jgi:hypothetical protein